MMTMSTSHEFRNECMLDEPANELVERPVQHADWEVTRF